jgi:hypothetical protein
MTEIKATRFSCEDDKGQSVYPLLNFIGLIEHTVKQNNGTTQNQTVKCSRNAAASIGLVCAENSYEQAALILNRLAGLDISTMTEFRVTDCVGAEFVEDVPAQPESEKIKGMTEKIEGNIMQLRLDLLSESTAKDEIIKKAVEDKPEGVSRKEYVGSVSKVMYIECDGTGVPGRHKELAGVRGKQSDGSAKTFEAKIGATFVVEYTADGRPLLTENGEIHRDKNVKYMGTTRKVEDFGSMLYQHAVENGLADVDAVVFLGDGAKWVWGIQDTYFPYAITCLDLYHSTERMNAMIDLLQFKGRDSEARKQAFKDECLEFLQYGKIKDMLNLIESMPLKKGNERKLDAAMGYFTSNAERMNYGILCACGIFVGSGVIEAGCKVIVGNRMKNSGMHWSKDHAEKMISLRCGIRNGDFFDRYLHVYIPSHSAT